MKFLKILMTLIALNVFVYASEEIPTQEEVAKLYVATFNRAPDSAGLDYWVNSSELKLSGIAQSFFDQPETQTLYPLDTTNRNFINSVYQNLFNRAPDTAGWDYWENELNTGAFSKNRFIEAVINGALDNETSNDATILNNKNEVGLHFASQGLSDVDQARTVMNGITDDSTRVTYIKEKIGSNNISTDVWNSYLSTFNGTYSGTSTHNSTLSSESYDYCGGDTTWTMTIANGIIEGTSSDPEDPIANGLIIDYNGIVSGTTSGGSSWSGTISSAGNMSGTYNYYYGNSECVGTFIGNSNSANEETTQIELSSNSFNNGEIIATKYGAIYTTGGQNISPQLSWNYTSSEIKSYAIIMDDEISPCGIGLNACVHWNVFNISSETTSLAEGYSSTYVGPYPPAGTTHTYNITIYALNTDNVINSINMTRAEFVSTYSDIILSSATISGDFTSQ